jgi:hypothetical protein
MASGSGSASAGSSPSAAESASASASGAFAMSEQRLHKTPLWRHVKVLGTHGALGRNAVRIVRWALWAKAARGRAAQKEG